MRRLPAFVLAVLVATLWGSIAQTQVNLAALAELGAAIPASVRRDTTLQDLVGFAPLYVAVVVPGLLVAFPIAARLGRRGGRRAWFTLAGFAALVAAIRLVDVLVPPPVLIAATRTNTGLVLLACGGALAGFVYAHARTRRRDP